MVRGIILNHQDKGRAFLQALGDSLVEYDKAHGVLDFDPDFALIDNDVYGRGFLERLAKKGCQNFFVYPHDAGPNLTNDIHPAWNRTTAAFVTTPRHAEIMGLYGYEKPIHVIGWHLCKQRPFKPTDGRRVLFAPIHPRCAAEDQEANRKAFDILAALAKDDKIELTVRYIGNLKDSNIPRLRNKNIKYVEGRAEPAIWQIDRADVVVAYLTFAYLAAARGKPLIYFGSDLVHHLLPLGQPLEYAPNWDRYSHLMRYPYDIADTDDPFGMILEASAFDNRVAAWRKEMIGEPFNPDTFRELIAGYYSHLKRPIVVDEKAGPFDHFDDVQLAKYRMRFGSDQRTWPLDFKE